MARRRGKAEAGKAQRPAINRQKLHAVTLDEVKFSLGDCVYVRLEVPNGKGSDSSESDAEEEDCRVCGQFGGTMIECDGCLGGFHLSCLDPPLVDVPHGLWFCPSCLNRDATSKGTKHTGRRAGARAGATIDTGPLASNLNGSNLEGKGTRRRRRTLRERYFDGELCVGRLERLWRNVAASANANANVNVNVRAQNSNARGSNDDEKERDGGGMSGEDEREGGQTNDGSRRGSECARKGDVTRTVSLLTAGRGGGEVMAGRREDAEAREQGGNGVGQVETRLQLGEVVVEEGKEEEYWCRVRWFVLPEETHAGRRVEHHGREVFLTNIKNDVEVATLVRTCQVLSASEFSCDSSSTAGDDVYLCRYSWHDEKRQFKRLTAGGLRGKKRGEGEDGTGNLIFKDEESSDMEGSGGDSDSDASFHAGGVASESEEERVREGEVEEEDKREGGNEDGDEGDNDSRENRTGKKRKGKLKNDKAKKLGTVRASMQAGRTGKKRRGMRAAVGMGSCTSLYADLLSDESDSEGGSKEEDERREDIQQQQQGGSGGRQSAASASASIKVESLSSKAKAALQLCAVPTQLPCREKEQADVLSFVHRAVSASASAHGRRRGAGKGEGSRESSGTGTGQGTGSGTGSGSRCLYISGVPGTGKTATVTEAMRQLRRKSKAGRFPAFQFIHINALALPSPNHFFSVLWERLTGQRAGWRSAMECLNDHFQQHVQQRPRPTGGTPTGTHTGTGTASDTRPATGSGAAATKAGKRGRGKWSRGGLGSCPLPCVLLVDELDLLVTRNQRVLYNLFEWPLLPNSNVSVIGIANTMDLPERLLPRIASRVGLQRLPFAPYSREQMEAIVADRLAGGRGREGGGRGESLFAARAIELAARKVASVSGDVRRALEICRRAIEIAEEREAERERDREAGQGGGEQGSARDEKREEVEGVQVRMSDVEVAVREVFSSPHMEFMRQLSVHEKLFLAAVARKHQSSGDGETSMGEATAAYTTFAASLASHHCPDCHKLQLLATAEAAADTPAIAAAPSIATATPSATALVSAPASITAAPATATASSSSSRRHSSLWQHRRLQSDELQALSHRLAAMHLLLCEDNGVHRHGRLRLTVPREDVAHVLSSDPVLHWLGPLLVH